MDVLGHRLLAVAGYVAPALLDELFEDRLRHVHQAREHPHDDHVRRPWVAGRTAQLIEGNAEAGTVVLHLERLRVIDNDAALSDLVLVGFVGVLVERYQHVELVAATQYRFGGNTYLEPRRPARDLGREGRKRLRVVSGLYVGGREALGD